VERANPVDLTFAAEVFKVESGLGDDLGAAVVVDDDFGTRSETTDGVRERVSHFFVPPWGWLN
jgi:hypothetical protein